jgi:tryptophan synthase alpha subunit
VDTPSTPAMTDGYGLVVPGVLQVAQVAALADGVVVGSAIVNTIDSVPADAPSQERAEKLRVREWPLGDRT